MPRATHILPGDRLPTDAPTWNAIVQSAAAFAGSQVPDRGGGPIKTDVYPGLIIMGHNTTSSTLVRGMVVKALPPHGGASDIGRMHRHEVVHPLVYADLWSSSLVRVIDVIPSNKVGRCTIISPHSSWPDAAPGTLGVTPTDSASYIFRHFAGGRCFNAPYYDSGMYEYGSYSSGPFQASFGTNWSVTGWPGTIQPYAIYTPVMRVDSTAPISGWFNGFYPRHPVRFHATFVISATLVRTRYAVQISGVDVGYAYDGALVTMTLDSMVGTYTAAPVYMPMYRNAAGTASPATPPATLEQTFVLRAETHRAMRPQSAARIRPTFVATKIPAFASGGPSSPNLTLQLSSDRVRFEIFDIDDSIDADGPIAPSWPAFAGASVAGPGDSFEVWLGSPSATLTWSGGLGAMGALKTSSPSVSLAYGRGIGVAVGALDTSSPPANLFHAVPP